MNVTMLTDMAFQVSGSSSGKQSASSGQVQSTFSFSSELKKQLSSLNKDVSKAAKNNDTAATGKSDDNETDKTQTKEKDESIEAADILTPQVLMASQVLPVDLPQAQNTEVLEDLLLSQPQDSTILAVNSIQDASAVMAPVLQTSSDTALTAQPASTGQQQSLNTENLLQQGNIEVVQSTPAPGSQSFSQSGMSEQSSGAHTANQSIAQATSQSDSVTADKQPTEKSDKDSAQQLTQQLSSFSDKLHNAGLSLRTEATAATPLPSAPQTSPSEQVATGVLNAYSDGKMEFTMKLKPENLGELTVKMVLNDGKLTMNIVTGNQQTAKLIESQIPELRASLKDNNIQMESCSVENQSFNNLASSGNYFMSGSKQGSQPYETRRIVLARPAIQEVSTDETTLMGRIAGTRYVQQAMLNCYV